MPSAPISAGPRSSRVWGGVAGVAVGVTISGAALLMARGPDLHVLPDMVAVPSTTQPVSVLYVQTHEVTVAEWNRCHEEGACALLLHVPAASGDETYQFPATGLNWVDANQYLTWINRKTGHSFRLPTYAEWFALAVTVLPETPDPIFTSPDLTWASAYLLEEDRSRRLMPSGSFDTTATGIADLDGNVWEWTQDCYAGTSGATDQANCPAFIAAGEHEAIIPFLVRDPARGGCAVGAPPAHLGMRLVSDKPLPKVSRWWSSL